MLTCIYWQLSCSWFFLWKSTCCFWSWRELTQKINTSCVPFEILSMRLSFRLTSHWKLLFLKIIEKLFVVPHTPWEGFLSINVILRESFFLIEKLLLCCFWIYSELGCSNAEDQRKWLSAFQSAEVQRSCLWLYLFTTDWFDFTWGNERTEIADLNWKK